MAQSVAIARPRPAALARPRARWADDLLVSLFGAWAVLGTVLDSWAHFSRRPDSFFTPWHAVLYSGTFAMVGWTSWVAWRRRVPGGGRRALLPAGYGLGLVGFAIFLAGAAGDLTWHTVLGIETNLDGGAQPHPPHPYPGRLPAVHHPVALRLGAARERAGHARVPSVLVSNLVMLGPVLLALRRWRLPFGTVTLLFTGFALAQVAVHAFDGVRAVTAAVGGLAADTLIGLGALPRRRRSLLVATVVPVVLWSGWLLALAVDRELAWTPALCSGTVMLAALSGLALHVLLFPPSAPASAGDPLTTRPHRGPDRSGTP